MGPPRGVPERFLSRPRRAYWAGISLLGVVALMALVVPAEPLRLDQRWSEAMRDIRTPVLTDLALVFNALGRGLGWALSLTAVGVVLGYLTPVAGAIYQEAVDVAVILNALRALRS